MRMKLARMKLVRKILDRRAEFEYLSHLKIIKYRMLCYIDISVLERKLLFFSEIAPSCNSSNFDDSNKSDNTRV